MTSLTSKHVARSHDDERLLAGDDKSNIKIGQHSARVISSSHGLFPAWKARGLDAGSTLHRANILVHRRNKTQPSACAHLFSNKRTTSPPGRAGFRESGGPRIRIPARQHIH